jgi:hypothetical protein
LQTIGHVHELQIGSTNTNGKYDALTRLNGF